MRMRSTYPSRDPVACRAKWPDPWKAAPNTAQPSEGDGEPLNRDATEPCRDRATNGGKGDRAGATPKAKDPEPPTKRQRHQDEADREAPRLQKGEM